jgi:hypothetical protein
MCVYNSQYTFTQINSTVLVFSSSGRGVPSLCGSFLTVGVFNRQVRRHGVGTKRFEHVDFPSIVPEIVINSY